MKQLWTFISIILLASWTIGFSMVFFSNEETDLPAYYTYTPALITILWLLFRKESLKNLKWKLKRPWWMYLLVLYIPLFYFIPELIVHVLSGAVDIELPYEKLPRLLIVGIILNGTIGLGIGILGEEIAWRGYLQDKIIAVYGWQKGVFLLGLIWGIWHLPLTMRGLNMEDNWAFEAFIFNPVLCIALSYIIYWALGKCNTIWIAVFLHASNNSVYYMFGKYITVNNDWLYTIIAMAWLIILAVLFFYFIKQGNVGKREIA